MVSWLKILFIRSKLTGKLIFVLQLGTTVFNCSYIIREPQWSTDEHLLTRIVNTDVVFYEDANFERIVTRINCCKVASYSISPATGTYFVLCHTPGGSGQPSFGR